MSIPILSGVHNSSIFVNDSYMISNKKKVLFFCMIIFVCSVLLVVPSYDYGFLNYVRSDSEICFYTTTKNNNTPNFVKKLDVGSGEILQCHSSFAKQLRKRLDGVAGISFSFQGDEDDIESFFKDVDAVVLSCENVDDELTIYMAYSPKFQNKIFVDGCSVNLQIAFSKNTITIGSPIILGEY